MNKSRMVIIGGLLVAVSASAVAAIEDYKPPCGRIGVAAILAMMMRQQNMSMEKAIEAMGQSKNTDGSAIAASEMREYEGLVIAAYKRLRASNFDAGRKMTGDFGDEIYATCVKHLRK